MRLLGVTTFPGQAHDGADSRLIQREFTHAGNLVKATRALRAKFITSHFLSPEGVCFPYDQQGCVFWNVIYHWFYAVQVDGKGS